MGYKSEKDEEKAHKPGEVTVTVYCDEYKILIAKDLMDKMFGWANAAKGEVSGMGLVRRAGDIFTIYDVFILPQESDAGYTELDRDGLAKLSMDLHKKGAAVKDLRFWWHSHADFGVFFSSTDDTCANALLGANGEWGVSIVVNKKRDYLSRIDLYDPLHVTITGKPVDIVAPIDPMLAIYAKDVADNVRDRWAAAPSKEKSSFPVYKNGRWVEEEEGRDLRCLRCLSDGTPWNPGSTWTDTLRVQHRLEDNKRCSMYADFRDTDWRDGKNTIHLHKLRAKIEAAGWKEPMEWSKRAVALGYAPNGAKGWVFNGAPLPTEPEPEKKEQKELTTEEALALMHEDDRRYFD